MEREHEVEARSESGDQAGASADVGGEIVEELLIEEISIDGMCGVY